MNSDISLLSSSTVLGWTDGQLAASHMPKEIASSIAARIQTLGEPTSENSTVHITMPGNDKVHVVVVFLPSHPSPAHLREATGRAVREMGAQKHVVIDMPHSTVEEHAAIEEGALLGSYSFDVYRATDTSVPTFEIVTDLPDVGKPNTHVEISVAAQQFVQNLVNTPAADLYPEHLEKAARELVSNLDVEVTSWSGTALEEMGCGGLIGVGKGSVHEPRLVKLDWNPNNARTHVALVGKGITFDSGGMSLKSHEGMIDMKTDMTGAATVAATVFACASLGVPVRVTAWMCIAENMLSGTSMHVGDVLRIANGTTVEVNNTDAEGRLVLADGLSHAVRDNPDQIIDVATLTGAQIRALGNRYAGLMGTDELVTCIVQAAEKAGEYIWPMPLPDYLMSVLDSKIADMRNTGTAEAGMLTAGLFLRRFTGGLPWAHIDIAGPSFNPGSPWGYTPSGATGYGVRTLLTHIETLATQ